MYTESKSFTAFTNGVGPFGQNGELIAHAIDRSWAQPVQDSGSRYIPATTNLNEALQDTLHPSLLLPAQISLY
jgi:hypothetical protein